MLPRPPVRALGNVQLWSSLYSPFLPFPHTQKTTFIHMERILEWGCRGSKSLLPSLVLLTSITQMFYYVIVFFFQTVFIDSILYAFCFVPGKKEERGRKFRGINNNISHVFRGSRLYRDPRTLIGRNLETDIF